jgi:hypothetical protein
VGVHSGTVAQITERCRAAPGDRQQDLAVLFGEEPVLRRGELGAVKRAVRAPLPGLAPLGLALRGLWPARRHLNCAAGPPAWGKVSPHNGRIAHPALPSAELLFTRGLGWLDRLGAA